MHVGIYVDTHIDIYIGICIGMYNSSFLFMTIISVKFYNFGTSILWMKRFACNLPKYRGFTVAYK